MRILEDYVSFEVAKLMKNKGFNSDWVIGQKCTHQMALKWLREVYKIVLDIAFETNKGWTFYVCHLITETLSDGSTYIVNIQHSVWSDDVQQPYYSEYEQAVEAALKYTLKNLI